MWKERKKRKEEKEKGMLEIGMKWIERLEGERGRERKGWKRKKGDLEDNGIKLLREEGENWEMVFENIGGNLGKVREEVGNKGEKMEIEGGNKWEMVLKWLREMCMEEGEIKLIDGKSRMDWRIESWKMREKIGKNGEVGIGLRLKKKEMLKKRNIEKMGKIELMWVVEKKEREKILIKRNIEWEKEDSIKRRRKRNDELERNEEMGGEKENKKEKDWRSEDGEESVSEERDIGKI